MVSAMTPRCFDCGIENEVIVKHRCAVCREVQQRKRAIIEPAMKAEVNHLQRRTTIARRWMLGCLVVAVLGLANGSLPGGLLSLTALVCLLALSVANLRCALRIQRLTREMLDMYAPLPSALTDPRVLPSSQDD